MPNSGRCGHVYLCTNRNTYSRFLDIADDRRAAFSTILVGNQIDALMFVKGVGWRFGSHGSGVVGWCSDRVVAGLRTRQGWASVMARKLLLGHASRSEMRPGTADESLAGQQVRGSRISGQAVPGDLGVSRRPGGGEGRPPGRRNASGSG